MGAVRRGRFSSEICTELGKKKSKAITATVRGGPKSYATSKLPHCLDKHAYRWRWCQSYQPSKGKNIIDVFWRELKQCSSVIPPTVLQYHRVSLRPCDISECVLVFVVSDVRTAVCSLTSSPVPAILVLMNIVHFSTQVTKGRWQFGDAIEKVVCSSIYPKRCCHKQIYSALNVCVAQWLRRYTTSRKVAGSRPDREKNFFFSLPNPSGRTGPRSLLSL
jgi:hypothetical protein